MTLISNVTFHRIALLYATQVALPVLSLIVKFFNKKVMCMKMPKYACALLLKLGNDGDPKSLHVDTNIRLGGYVNTSLVDKLIRMKAFGLLSKARFVVRVTDVAATARVSYIPFYLKVGRKWDINPDLLVILKWNDQDDLPLDFV